MKTLFFSLVVLLGSSLQVANATPITSTNDAALTGFTLMDFETAPLVDISRLPNRLLSLPGLTIQKVCCGRGGPVIKDSTNPNGDISRSVRNTKGDTVDLVFDEVISAFGMVTYGAIGPWAYTVFDSNNNLLEQLHVNDTCCESFFHGIQADGIKRINISAVSFGGNHFDDLRYVSSLNTVSDTSANPVPEPSTMLLVGTGLVGLIAWRHRKSLIA